MITAHIPASYLLAKFRIRRALTASEVFVLSAAAILPDADLIRFYFFDNRQHHHHEYWTHIPMVWLMVYGVFLLISRKLNSTFKALGHLFFASICLHLALDSIAGEIQWLWPISTQGFHFVTVPATHDVWYLSFLFHWTAWLELAVWIIALTIFVFRRGEDFPFWHPWKS